MSETAGTRAAEWPLRPWLLAALLGTAGSLLHFVTDWKYDDIEPWRAALAGFLLFAPLALAFTLDRDRWRSPLVFALVVGAVMAGIAWRVARAQDHFADEGYWLAAAIVSVALAVPLFQAGFHKLRWRTSYDETHFHVWTDAITAAGALAFFLLSWLLAHLLGGLFAAIEIDILRDLLGKGWFVWIFAGLTFGAALGVLRNQLKIIGTLQSVVMLVFSLMAVPFAAALGIFIVAVLFSGLEVLWRATQSPTPLLLACAAASFVLVNSVIRSDDGEASGNRVLRWAGLVLALGILPLAIMAAISTGTRIAEYGLSPERIWGLVAIVVAVTYGVAYFVAPIRGRMAQWMQRIRTANLHLAVGTCLLAFLLALPLFDFGAISARNQVARLASGDVPVEDFDYDALRWDFGDAGRRALVSLEDDPDGAIRRLAKAAQKRQERPWRLDEVFSGNERLTSEFVVYPSGSALPAGLKDAIRREFACRGDAICRVYLQSDGSHAVVLTDRCKTQRAADPAMKCSVDAEPFGLSDQGWQVLRNRPEPADMNPAEERASLQAERRAIETGDVTIGPSREREIYVGGKPTGRQFE